MNDRGPEPSRVEETGASLVEYALLLAFILVVCVVAVGYFGTATSDTFSRSNSAVSNS